MEMKTKNKIQSIFNNYKLGKRVLAFLEKIKLDNSCENCPFLFENKQCLFYEKPLKKYFLLYGFPRERLNKCKEEIGA